MWSNLSFKNPAIYPKEIIELSKNMYVKYFYLCCLFKWKIGKQNPTETWLNKLDYKGIIIAL